MKYGLRLVVLRVFPMLLAVSLLTSGCKLGRGNRNGGVGGDEPLNPIGLGDDGSFALGPRGEFGVPITNARFDPVYFGYDSFQIDGVERMKIESVADYLLANPQVTVLIDGHCDERGSREYNLSLGEHRALAVRAYLISLGVAGDRIQTRSFGEEMPVNPGTGEMAWSENRRGEFSFFAP